jgi:methionyl-tRNA formyltransferase
MARIVFLGTPSFAMPILASLCKQHQVLAVITQPDQPGGRGRHELIVSPVKAWAASRGLMILQPDRISRDKKTLNTMRDLKPDVLVLAAYGQILRLNVLSIAPFGCIGVHASLLPKLRGAAPIATAILRGEVQTGISLMLTNVGMDTGPVLTRRIVEISPLETTTSLTEKLAVCGAETIIETLPKWLAGEIAPELQEDALATYAPPLMKEQGALNWSLSAVELDRHIRALNPWPGTYTHHAGSILKVLEASPLPEMSLVMEPGLVISLPKGIGVTAGQGALQLQVVQLAGKRAMSVIDYSRGHRDFIGAELY